MAHGKPENPVFLLGGHDLEMQTIGELVADVYGPGHVRDRGLAWGAVASAYESDIRALLAGGRTPVLVELTDDLPADIPRAQLVFVDHHGDRAGAAMPSSLRQVHALLPDAPPWSRRFSLVEANDIGHIRALRAMGASAEEIRRIRDADRKAQGVSAADEAEARRAVAAATTDGTLTTVTSRTPGASAIGDMVEPEYGGPGADDLLVVTPAGLSFYGAGHVVRALADVPDSWHGGALPARGYWGISGLTPEARTQHIATIRQLCHTT